MERCQKHAHIFSVNEVLRCYDVKIDEGLAEDKVFQLRKIYGYNELPPEPAKPWWHLVLAQLNDLIIWILLGAATISFILAFLELDNEDGIVAYVEPVVILVILVLNAAVGVWQDSSAEKALKSLKRLQPRLARCLRNGIWSTISSSLLVPGDIIEVRVGDRVPADARVLSLRSITLRIEQSSLTGESASVLKDVDRLASSYHDCEIQAKTNMVFASTAVVAGQATACVVATGLNSEIGIIQSAVQEADEESHVTPLQRKIDEFAQSLSYAIAMICVFVWLINYKNFYDPLHGGLLGGCVYYFKIAVALAVAAIPEGLPAVITTCLALGTRKLAQKNAIIRKLPSVETLGCTSVICSDKTGTLTTNKMSCVRFCIPVNAGKALRHFKVEGSSYSPIGEVTYSQEGFQSKAKFDNIRDEDVSLKWLAKCAVYCNSANIESDAGNFSIQGEPTEGALLVLVEKLKCPSNKMLAESSRDIVNRDPMLFCKYWKQFLEHVAVLDFSRERKSMSTLCYDHTLKKNILFIKGSPEGVIDRSTSYMLANGQRQELDAHYRETLLNAVSGYAESALRVLALAVRFDCEEFSDYDGPTHPCHSRLSDPENFLQLERDFTFIGLVGLLDPPRPEVFSSIARCRKAGIKVLMITGDNKTTAEAIGRLVGITPLSCVPPYVSITGKEFDNLSEEAQLSFVKNDGLIFSRMEPRQKQMVVKCLKTNGEITAVTGDGVNDAPALKMADIGVSMGLTGTEVAKEASDMVLADDDFSSIVTAVQEGRAIYNNMKAFIRYLISSNIGEVASIFMTAAMGIPEGLAPVQLLWVNLVTDGMPAIALGFNPPDPDIMDAAPRRSDDQLINKWIFFRYIIIGMYVGFATVGILVYWYIQGDNSIDAHTHISYSQLTSWVSCKTWEDFNVIPVYGMPLDDPCSYFTKGKVKASTLCLTVLVVIEMLNALNALSENNSILQVPPWANPYLVLAICGSIFIHCCILYVPFLSQIFGVVPLSWSEWKLVLYWSFPVILIDEILKAIGRTFVIRNASLPIYKSIEMRSLLHKQR